MMRLQGQQLNEQSRFAARPPALVDHATIHYYLKRSEQADL
jgi:hypothetical protein